MDNIARVERRYEIFALLDYVASDVVSGLGHVLRIVSISGGWSQDQVAPQGALDKNTLTERARRGKQCGVSFGTLLFLEEQVFS